jgi:Fe-S-cluster containining protein
MKKPSLSSVPRVSNRSVKRAPKTSRSRDKLDALRRGDDAAGAGGVTRQRVKKPLPIYREPVTASGKAQSGAAEPTCAACGLCCTYVAIEVDAPSTVKRATQLLFYLYHRGVSVYANEDEWMVQFDSTCQYLQPDHRCGIYHTRPHICREFSEQDCEVNTGDDGHTFYNATEFLTYLQQTRPRVHSLVQKSFAPPVEPARTRLEPFEKRAAAVRGRRSALGIIPS